MSARTPGPKDILGNVIAHDCITFRLQGRDIPLQMLQSARDEAENYRETTITLTSQVAALRDALRSIYHTLYEADTPNRQGPEYRDAISAAREQISAALAKDGAR